MNDQEATDTDLPDDEWTVTYKEARESLVALTIALSMAIRRLVPEDQQEHMVAEVMNYLMKEFCPAYLHDDHAPH